MNRLIQKTYPDSTTDSFTYDSNGRVIKYEYDTSGNRTQITASDVVRSFSFAYNYTYDSTNRLTELTSPFEKGGLRGIFSFAYDTAGRRTKLTYPNEVTTTYSYDSIGRLTNLLTQYAELQSQGKNKTPTLKLHTLDSFTYTHDKVGNRLSKTDTDTYTHTYNYDTIYRLLQSMPVKIKHNGKEDELENKAEIFTYDPVGNRLTGPKDKLNYTYNEGNQLSERNITSPLAGEGQGEGDSPDEKKTEYTYDKNGNLTKKLELDDDGNIKTITLYTYDFENRLIQVEIQKDNRAKIVTFTYDPFGRRIEKKTEETEEGKSKIKIYTYVYDNEDIILEYLTKLEDGKTKTETTRYIHGFGIDEPLAIERKGEGYYYHANGLGSITAMTDKKQKVVESYTYSSFGEFKRYKDKVKNTYTFTGRVWDEEINLYYYRARYYDPKTGRFISKDPIGFAGGDMNLYVMTWNNPVNWIDPLGLWTYPTIGPIRGYDPWWGSGAYWASRDNGGRRHMGVDYSGGMGTNVYAPMSGTIETIPGGVRITGRVDGEIYSTRILHVNPSITSGYVTEGSIIGTIQNLSNQYPGMINHAHVELYQIIKKQTIRLNPTEFIPEFNPCD